MSDPLDDQFSDTSLLDYADLSKVDDATLEQVPQAQGPVHTQMYAHAQPPEPRLTDAQALAKSGSVVPGSKLQPSAPGTPIVAAPATGTYTPFLLAAVAAVAGGMYAGWWGAATGALGVGALVNANRWRKGIGSKGEDAIFALATAGGAVYAGYKAHKHRQETASKPSKEPDVLELDEDDEPEEVQPNATKPARRAWLRPVRK